MSFGFKSDIIYLPFKDPKCGSMYIANEVKKAMLEVSVASGYYSTASNWSFYYHSITSPKEKSAVACLLNDTQSFDGYVYTWQKVGENNEVVRIIWQLIRCTMMHYSLFHVAIYVCACHCVCMYIRTIRPGD